MTGEHQWPKQRNWQQTPIARRLARRPRRWRDDAVHDGRDLRTSLFHTAEERDGMLSSGMETGLSESYAALVRLLAGRR
jgi:hypothetical protein